MRSLFGVSRSHQGLKSKWGVKQNYRISSANASIRVNDFGVLFRSSPSLQVLNKKVFFLNEFFIFCEGK